MFGLPGPSALVRTLFTPKGLRLSCPKGCVLDSEFILASEALRLVLNEASPTGAEFAPVLVGGGGFSSFSSFTGISASSAAARDSISTRSRFMMLSSEGRKARIAGKKVDELQRFLEKACKRKQQKNTEPIELGNKWEVSPCKSLQNGRPEYGRKQGVERKRKGSNQWM